MAHMELSLSSLPETSTSTDAGLSLWSAAVRGSADACMLLDTEAKVRATSTNCRELLGLADDIDSTDITLLESGIELLDFTASAGRLPYGEAHRMPPMQALTTGSLSRGLLRVYVGELPRTVDAVATPLHSTQTLIGSLTFLRRC